MDQRALILRVQAGDSAAFNELYHACYAPVYRFVLFRVKDRDQAEDIVQDVFIKLFQKIGTIDDRNQSILPYLFVSARNAVIDRMRQTKPTLDDESLWSLASEDPTPEQESHLGEAVVQVMKLLSQLSEAEEVAIKMKYLDGLETSEISHILGKSEEAVRQLLSRGIRKIRTLLESTDRTV